MDTDVRPELDKGELEKALGGTENEEPDCFVELIEDDTGTAESPPSIEESSDELAARSRDKRFVRFIDGPKFRIVGDISSISLASEVTPDE